MTYLAHSAKPERSVPVQEYRDHIESVVRIAVANAYAVAKYSPKYGELLRAAVRQAAEFHDLGKLDETNQEVLRNNRGKMLNHVDAGVAHLLKDARRASDVLAAVTVFAHHIGLPEWAFESTRGAGKFLRDTEPTTDGWALCDLTNRRLEEYRKRHAECVSTLPAILSEAKWVVSPLLWRMALSCLVDADHTDTARNYREPVASLTHPQLFAEKRLKLLDEYVAELGRHREDERTPLRTAVYRQCYDADCSAGLVTCDSPVGSGKTTAIMAHLLKAAMAKKLRRVFVVLPFTNIIDQSVAVYRKSLVDTNEAADEIVVAHHHKAEFDDINNPSARPYSFLWHAPIVVTTAVQFFETLAARKPNAVRKLHQVAGSAIFIDEAHTALPAHLWPQALKWLQELEREWNCHFVLGSGSLHRFWELPDFVDPPQSFPSIVTKTVQQNSAEHERRRVTFRSHADPFDLEGLSKFVKKTKGPRLLIVNTVQSAAAIARYFKERFGGERVKHLSTSLTPGDRKATLELVKLRLRHPNNVDWTLVATSCVEAGVDFSFRTGIRERCSLTSLLQTSGRVNRSNEFEQADVWDIQLRHDHLLRAHPAFEASVRVLGELFVEGKVSPEFCTEALRREIRQEGIPKKKEDILKAERNANFPEVEKLFRVIDSETVTAVVEEELIRRLEDYERVTRADIQLASVQIWHSKVQEFGLEQLERVRGFDDLRKWMLPYDSFLGYMAGVLPLVDSGHTGFII